MGLNILHNNWKTKKKFYKKHKQQSRQRVEHFDVQIDESMKSNQLFFIHLAP